MARFAEEIVFRARKNLVLADTAKIANTGFMPVVITAISEQKRPKDVMSAQRGLGAAGLIAETQLDIESEKRRAASPGVFDPEFRLPVNVAFGSEQYPLRLHALLRRRPDRVRQQVGGPQVALVRSAEDRGQQAAQR